MRVTILTLLAVIALQAHAWSHGDHGLQTADNLCALCQVAEQDSLPPTCSASMLLPDGADDAPVAAARQAVQGHPACVRNRGPPLL